MKTILVTGSNGTLGQAVIACLRKAGGFKVVTTSRKGGAGSLQLDVGKPEQIANVIDQTKPDIIFHLVATFVNDFDVAYAINVEATKQLLNVVESLDWGVRVLLTGSAAEYGAVRIDENPILENRIQRPVSVYGLTKAWQTQLAGLYASRGVNVVVARVFNLDGPNMSGRLFIGRLQAQIADVLAGRESFIELGSLTATRDYISTEVAATQMLAIALNGIAGQVYHVASGKPVTMRDVLNRYLLLHGLNENIVHESAELTNHSGYDVPVIYADISSTLQLIKVKMVDHDA